MSKRTGFDDVAASAAPIAPAEWVRKPARVVRQGNSASVRLTRDVVLESGFDVGTDVEVRATRGRIEIVRQEGERAEERAFTEAIIGRYGRVFKALAE